MEESLRLETEKLVRSWLQYDAPFLRDYLVADVEDPRINVQSLLSRHFLIASLFGDKFRELVLHELRFAATMNWLAHLAGNSGGAEESRAVLHALEHGADNAEGLQIPHYISATFRSLPLGHGELIVPNYIRDFLVRAEDAPPRPVHPAPGYNTFVSLWRTALSQEQPPRVSVLEPACGSANDYRFLEGCGLARLVDYTGFDLCEKNVANARALFPDARFLVGNVFEIAAPDQAYELCFLHDLLEHLSPAGLERAVQELCRVTRHGLCVNFFQMDEMPDPIVRPVEDYHVTTLSLARSEALFARHGFAVQALHVGAYLRTRISCNETHNPNAYTFLAFRR
jgi:SAM-dependent methyltransferase